MCTLYGHCSQVIVIAGQTVHQGEVKRINGAVKFEDAYLYQKREDIIED
jgi:hypothetical protein